jgi:formylglycine-generating enzyme required for sulfatase activity
MGSPESEEGRFDSESPQHRVSVPSFFMAKYPVTQAQWRIVSKMPQVKLNLKPNPSKFKGDTRPVEQVSWDEAIEFCERLTIHTKRQYRLPTEAEWEYACRAGTTTPFHFGKTISPELANYNSKEAYGDGLTGKYRGETTLVDHFKIANAWGLCDMSGNVFEWCLDHWHDSYEKAPSDGSVWLSETYSSLWSPQVIRGGSWISQPLYCRSAYRFKCSSKLKDTDIGFRVIAFGNSSLDSK